MKLSDVSIRRPVLASMISSALVLFGVIGYTQLSVREFPDVDPPIISVTTVLPGANPRVVESAVTDRLEEELSTTPGLRTLTSSSAEHSLRTFGRSRASRSAHAYHSSSSKNFRALSGKRGSRGLPASSNASCTRGMGRVDGMLDIPSSASIGRSAIVARTPP